MLVFVLGLAAAVFLALGFVIQQHVAETLPAQERLTLRLLVDLARRPVWLGGIAAMIVGQLLGGSALDQGNVALVEPLLAANLLFALPMTAAWHRRRLHLREWTGAVLLMAGLAGFVVAGAPGGGGGDSPVSSLSWSILLLAVAAVVAGLTYAGKRSDAKHSDVLSEATLLASAAGILYGLQDALTRRTLQLFQDGNGVLAALSSWQPYILLLVGITGLLLAQSAFQEAPLTASLPAVTIAEPLAGIAIGVGLFSENLRLSPLPLAFELVGIALMIAGVILVARSPLLVPRCAPSTEAEHNREPV